MSQSLRIAKQVLVLMGKSKRSVNIEARELAGSLKRIVAGQSRGAKKKFYDAYEALINNTSDVNSRNIINSFIEDSETVARQAQRQTDIEVSNTVKRTEEMIAQMRQEYVPSESEIKLAKLLGEDVSTLSIMDDVIDYEKMVREYIADSIFRMNEAVARTKARSQILTVPIASININNAKNTALQSLEKELGDISIDVSLSENQIKEIVASAQREAYQGFLTSVKEKISLPFRKMSSWFAYPAKASSKIKPLKEIPENYQMLFASLQGKSGQEYIDLAYENIVKYMGLNNIAPKKFVIDCGDALTITGGYNPITNTINYSEGFLAKLSRQDQAMMIAHELKHCEQFTNMLRTEGISVEKYARAYAESCVYQDINPSSLSNFLFRMNYEKALKNGTGEEFIQKAIERRTKHLIPEIEANFAEVLRLPKIKADSQEGKKALEQLETFKIFGVLWKISNKN